MSILERFNPLRIVRTVDTVPRLRDLGEKLREDNKAVARQLRTIAGQLARLEQALGAQKDVLAQVPELQARIGQCMSAYMKDARFADQVPALRAMLGDGERMAAHAAAAVARSTLQLDPCPYVVIEDLLPPDVCEELVGAMPSSIFFKSQDMSRQEMQVPFVFAPERSRLVWGLFFERVISDAMVRALTEKFRPALEEFVRATWPAFGSMAEAGITLRVSNSRLLLRRPGYVIKPHRDPRWAFLTCLVYLPKPGDAQSYGTQLYRLRHEPEVSHSSPLWADPAECELVRDVPAGRNTALVFLNWTGAHGASIPRDAPEGTERYVYQVQFSVDDETRHRLIDSLTGTARVGWAVARGSGYQ
jgi:hypothetical protein